jgi:hypothetical protein
MKALSDFHKDASRSDGVSPHCKHASVQPPSHTKAKVRDANRRRYMENRDEINMGRRVHPEVSGRGQFNKQNPK